MFKRVFGANPREFRGECSEASSPPRKAVAKGEEDFREFPGASKLLQ